jgi:hypothetical protein
MDALTLERPGMGVGCAAIETPVPRSEIAAKHADRALVPIQQSNEYVLCRALPRAARAQEAEDLAAGGAERST